MFHLSNFHAMMLSMIFVLLACLPSTTLCAAVTLDTVDTTTTTTTTFLRQRRLATSGGNKCGDAATSTTGYKYQRMANAFLTAVDDIASAQPDDVDAFYQKNVVAYSTDDVLWDIDAGTRQFQLEGTEAVRGLFESFSTRRFAFHQWSHYEVDDACDDGSGGGSGGVTVALRYHGVILEAEGNYQDIFGVIRVRYNADDLVEYVFVQRFHTIDRGYSA